MKNLLKIILVLCLICFVSTGCEDEETGILFNKEPITKDNVLNASRTFDAGQRIYYLFYTSKKINREFIRIQVFKAEKNSHVGGYVIVWTQDNRVMKDNDYYYYNYFVLHNPGKYVMQIFGLEDLSKPLAWNYFYVN